MALDPVDVVVVGSGAGGAPVALELARAGLSVVVLDKGRRYRDEDYDHDEIRMCRRNFFVPFVADEPHTVRRGEAAPATRTSDGWISSIVGGGTVHMAGYFHRLHPADFRLRSTLGSSVLRGSTAVDWPIAYDDLEPFYARAEAEVGVSGAWRRHPFEEPRSADYPMPPLPEHGLAAVIDKACAGLGLHPFPTPRAILSQDYRGRQACMFCALCASYGCEMGAKSSTAASLLPAAEATLRCQVRPQAMATEIPVGKDGRVTGVVYRDTSRSVEGSSVFQPARVVVVACTAIETARLLLLSRSSRHPKGLANDSGLVGKNLVFSGLTKGEALFRHGGKHKGAPFLVDRAPFVQRSLQDYYLLDQPDGGVRKGGTLLFALAHPNPIFTAERIAGAGATARWGRRLKEALRDEAAGGRTLAFENFAEFLPSQKSYVDLDPEVKDRWGAPVARITLDRHSHDTAANRLLAARGKRILDALGADEARVTEDDGVDMVLQGGTCRFGKDPAQSVLDVDCRAHGVPNLYVSDSSFMPTSGGVPLTLTILANAFRVGARLAARFKAGKV